MEKKVWWIGPAVRNNLKRVLSGVEGSKIQNLKWPALGAMRYALWATFLALCSVARLPQSRIG